MRSPVNFPESEGCFSMLVSRSGERFDVMFDDDHAVANAAARVDRDPGVEVGIDGLLTS